METFILKIYRRENGPNKLVGTLQDINSDQHFSFTTQKDLCSILASLLPDAAINQDEDLLDSSDRPKTEKALST